MSVVLVEGAHAGRALWPLGNTYPHSARSVKLLTYSCKRLLEDKVSISTFDMPIDRCLCSRFHRLVYRGELLWATIILMNACGVSCCGMLRDNSFNVCISAHRLSPVLYGRLLPLQRFQLAALLASGLTRFGSRKPTCSKSIKIMDKWELCPWLCVSMNHLFNSMMAIKKIHRHVCTCRCGRPVYSLPGCLYTLWPHVDILFGRHSCKGAYQ